MQKSMTKMCSAAGHCRVVAGIVVVGVDVGVPYLLCPALMVEAQLIAIVTYLDAVSAAAVVVVAAEVAAVSAAAVFAVIFVVQFVAARAVAVAVEEGRPREDVSIDYERHSRSAAAAEVVVEPARRRVFAVAVAAGTEHYRA